MEHENIASLTLSEQVLDFISKFNDKGTNTGTITTFTQGCCYWFAFILNERFKSFYPTIMVDQVENHFGTKIGNVVYDITGDVSDDYDWDFFSAIEDEAYLKRLQRDCIDKLT